MRFKLFIFVIFFCIPILVIANSNPLWMSYAAISPDGKTIVFSYKGDLYRVASSGGNAIALTSYSGHDYMPVWSHDSQTLAFASDRYGNFDVYTMSAQGGVAKRLTFHSAHDYPSDFTIDNQKVIFSSQRMDTAPHRQFSRSYFSELYQVKISGGRPDQLMTTTAERATFASNGKTLVFHDKKGTEDYWRKHHVSSVTRDLWTYNLDKDKYRQLTTFVGEDRNPHFAADDNTIFFLREPVGGTFNVFKMDQQQPQKAVQLTHFKHHPVRFLTVAGDNTLCFVYNGEIYTKKQNQDPQKMALQISADAKDKPETILSVTSRATDMAVSPSGKEVAFIYRGEVFATSVESSTTKRITNTPEQERSICFSPDGRSILYASERNQSWNLYQTKLTRKGEKYFFNSTLLKEEPVLISKEETFQPSFSPDGKEVAFLENRTTLRVISLASKEVRTILEGKLNFSYADGDQYYQWSPDGKWFLVQFQKPDYWNPEVGLIAADGKEKVFNLTESGYSDFSPKFMAKGKMMIWFSNRHGLRAHALSGMTQDDVYGMFLTREAWDRYKLTKEEYDLLKEQEKEKKDKSKDKNKDKKTKNKEVKEKIELLAIEKEGIKKRKSKLTIHSSSLADAIVTPDGEKLIYFCRLEKGYSLWETNLRTRETKIFMKLGDSGGRLQLDKDGKNLFILSGGSISKIDIKSKKKKSVAFSADMLLHPQKERAYMFEHVWRQVREKFYKPDLHKVQWDLMKKNYSRFLPHINNNHDFARMLGELLGELNASHTGARYYGSQVKNADQTASLGAFFDWKFQGNGLKIVEILPESPLIRKGSFIQPGTIIEKIDGQLITPDLNYYPMLNRKSGKYVLLSLFNEKTKKRWEETVKPIGKGTESSLLYRRWVETNKKVTQKRSKGRIGYVHVRSMSDSSYRTVFDEVMGELVNKEAIVVDTRFNGGGDLVEDLSNFLMGKPYMEFVPPHGNSIGMEPQKRWSKPSIVIMSQGNYSDAHCFPWAYNYLEIGKTVGMPVPGTCTFVWWERLQDRSLVFGIPNMGVTDPKGRFLENWQLEPDIKVENDPWILSQGRDQQLERAVDELLKQLK